jgi:hypothetical protein
MLPGTELKEFMPITTSLFVCPIRASSVPDYEGSYTHFVQTDGIVKKAAYIVRHNRDLCADKALHLLQLFEICGNPHKGSSSRSIFPVAVV